jgi:predicted XRE-type DNA-binding protein
MDFKTHKTISDTTADLINSVSIRLVCKLGKILEDIGMSQTELSYLTGIRTASINEMIHNKKNTINKQHALAVMVALNLTNFSDLYEVVFDNPADKEKLDKKREEMERLGLTEEQARIINERKKELEK